MRGRLLTVIVASFLFGALGSAALLVRGGGKAQIAGPFTQIGGPFTLVDQTGRTVTNQDFRGRYMLVFFGFTHCPDVCPAELRVMSASLDELGPKAEQVVPIFITLDPERDTPAAMGAYVKNFGSRFVGLTGSPDAISAAADAYRVAYVKVQEDTSKPDYSIDHSGLVYLMGKDGEYITQFTYGTPAAKMTETLRRHI